MTVTSLPATPRWLLPVSMLAGGFIALILGLPAEWDLLNYHLYGPHALLNDRLWIDIAPAQMQTYLNPLFHLPWYSLFYFAHPAAMVFVLGMLQGLHWLLLYLLVAELVKARPVPQWAIILISALGLSGPIFYSELGGTQGDTLISLLVIWSVLHVVRQVQLSPERQQYRTAIPAGVLLGIATALKLTFAIYTLALGFAWLVCAAPVRRWNIFLAYGIAAFFGFLLAGIAWCSYLYFEYQNPFFPYFNQVFHSPWVGDSSFRDTRFLPKSMWQWWFYPFFWLENNLPVWEWPTRDVRMVLLYPVTIGLLLLAGGWMLRRSRGLLLVCVFVTLSYAIWLPLFSIYRYLSVIELLAPIIMFTAAVVCYRRRHLATVVMLGLVLSLFFNVYWRSDSLWELDPGQDSALSTLPANSLVMINGFEAVGYAALWLDDHIPLVRTRANFINRSQPPFTLLQQEAHEKVRRHAGPVFLLLPQAESSADFLGPDLARLNLQWPGLVACEPVFKDERLQMKTRLSLCPLARLQTGPVQIASFRWDQAEVSSLP